MVSPGYTGGNGHEEPRDSPNKSDCVYCQSQTWRMQQGFAGAGQTQAAGL